MCSDVAILTDSLALKFRNYKPRDASLKESALPAVEVPDVMTEINAKLQQLEMALAANKEVHHSHSLRYSSIDKRLTFVAMCRH
jgi:hypothetical protein